MPNDNILNRFFKESKKYIVNYALFDRLRTKSYF